MAHLEKVELSLLILQFVAKAEFLWNFSVQIVERSCCSPGADCHQLLRTFSYSIWSAQDLAVLARQPTTLPTSRPLCLLEYS
jgi:hypothetical protein